jgi:hypothetical protein
MKSTQRALTILALMTGFALGESLRWHNIHEWHGFENIQTQYSMITRVWHGKTKKADADRYLLFLQQTGIKDYLRTPGNTGVRIWRRVEKDEAHFWTVSTWENIESIATFAGEDIGKAVYYPEDQEFLLEFEPTVTHMETYVIK